ncbi:MAG: transcriptional regulator [Candidatus Hydrogenedentes bacterium]|nr:transcriptional regulator [Candidatus Hydrogenedentota bacterium]
MSALDPLIHQALRLKIMAALVALEPRQQINFVELRACTGATDGNLGAHLQKLEEGGYIAMEKTFVKKKPCSFVQATNQGRAAFERHVAALRAIIGS